MEVFRMADGSYRSRRSYHSAHEKGRMQNAKGRSGLASEHDFHISGISGDQRLPLELGYSAKKKAVGAPIKRLMAQEMLNETDSRIRKPNIIAKLMGLDTFPAEQHVASAQRQRQAVGRFHQKGGKEKQEFKDVFEVSEISNTGRTENSSSYSIPRRSKYSKEKMEYFKPKFIDAKHLSSNDNLHGSKEFQDALEVLGSRRDLLLKFLREPNSSSRKHSHGSNYSFPKMESTNYWENVIEPSGVDPSNSSYLRRSHSMNVSRNKLAMSSLLSEINIEEKGGEDEQVPTRIVVLKPNLEKSRDTSKYFSSPSSSRANSESREHSRLGYGDYSRYYPAEPREMQRTTRAQRSGIRKISATLSPPCHSTYSGDESSCNMSGSESAYESDVRNRSSRKLFTGKNYNLPSSSVNKEAKKRLSKRWDLNQQFHQMETVVNGSKLGRILTISDKEIRPQNHECAVGPDGIASQSRTSGLKDKSINREGNVRYANTHCKSISSGNSEANDSVEDFFKEHQNDNIDTDCDQSEQSIMNDIDTTQVSATAACDKALPNVDSNSPELDDTSRQRPLVGSVTLSEEGSMPLCNPETDQPSPVSVLGTSFPEDQSSGSECFERVSAEIHGLRLQLQLLKLESETYSEGPMVVSSDDDSEEHSLLCESREILESSYLDDVLNYFNFKGADLNSFLSSSSEEYPIDAVVFDKIERKYCAHTSWPRSDRKLLFDRINSGLIQFLERSMDPRPWIVPISQMDKTKVRDEVCKLLGGRVENVNNCRVADCMLGQGDDWKYTRKEIDAVGVDIELLLMEELITEIIIM